MLDKFSGLCYILTNYKGEVSMKFVLYDVETGISRMELPIKCQTGMPEFLCYEPFVKYACYFPDSFTFEQADDMFFRWINLIFDETKLKYENFLDTIHWMEKK